MYSFPEELTIHMKRQKTQLEDTEKTSASDSDMTMMLESTGQEFKTTMINILKDLMDKLDSMQGQMSHVSREKILSKNQKEMLEIKAL